MHQWCTGWLSLHCRVFLVPCETCLSPCTEAYTRFQNNTAMFIWSPCIKLSLPMINTTQCTSDVYNGIVYNRLYSHDKPLPLDAVYWIKHKSLVFFSGWSINRTINQSSADIVPVIQGKVYFRLHRFFTEMMKFSGCRSNHNRIVFEEMSSLTALTWHIGMKTAFRPNISKGNIFRLTMLSSSLGALLKLSKTTYIPRN